jgi:hypothetical protein
MTVTEVRELLKDMPGDYDLKVNMSEHHEFQKHLHELYRTKEIGFCYFLCSMPHCPPTYYVLPPDTPVKRLWAMLIDDIEHRLSHELDRLEKTGGEPPRDPGEWTENAPTFVSVEPREQLGMDGSKELARVKGGAIPVKVLREALQKLPDDGLVYMVMNGDSGGISFLDIADALPIEDGKGEGTCILDSADPYSEDEDSSELDENEAEDEAEAAKGGD